MGAKLDPRYSRTRYIEVLVYEYVEIELTTNKVHQLLHLIILLYLVGSQQFAWDRSNEPVHAIFRLISSAMLLSIHGKKRIIALFCQIELLTDSCLPTFYLSKTVLILGFG